MRKTFFTYFLFAVLVPLVSAAQTRESGPWWPSAEWGADDEAGASNRITPDKVLEAIQLARSGTIYDLGHAYEPGMPLLGGRSYAIESSARPVATGTNRYAANEDFIAGQLGHVGTQFDALAHAGREVDMEDGSQEIVFYNGFTASEMDARYGFAHLGVQNVKPIVTRGILIDVAGSKGGRLSNGYEVTVDDVLDALARQGISETDISEGDAVIFRYGWAQLWDQPDAFLNRPPGIGPSVAEWLIAKQPVLVGSDAGSGIAVPGGFAGLHQEFLTFNGIFLIEYMNLEQLASDEAYEFMLIATPLALVGATGSPIRPLAIR